MKKIGFLFLLLTGVLSTTAQNIAHSSKAITAQQNLRISDRAKAPKMEMPDNLGYSLTYGTMPDNNKKVRTIVRKVADNGLTADFSIQGADAQKVVWSEDFDNGFDAWTFNQGEGNVITFTAENKNFSEIDENDKTSLHIDGPYQVYKRTIGTATSQEIDVPANAMLHTYILASKTWNEYVVLTLSVSTDNFATQTDVYSTVEITENGKAVWRLIEADLSAFTGQKIRIRLTYGPGTNDTFHTGGYMGDFAVDGMTITAVEAIDHINVKTGDIVKLADMSTGTPTAWEWSFPGGTPETSTEQNPEVYYTRAGSYAVTLKVSDAEGSDAITKTEFIVVEGQVPEPKIQCPAEFREIETRMHFVSPLSPVQYHDASTGYPTEWTWLLTNGPTMATDVYSHEQNPWIAYQYLGKQYAILVATNDTPHEETLTAYATDSVQVQYDGLATNFQAGETVTNFTDGELVFPGANKMGITAWAEKFSKPSRPIMVYGAYVYFTSASAEGLLDQIAPINISLCESDNGLPGKMIDMDDWDIPSIGYARSTAGWVTVEFAEPKVINDEFFFTIEGIPEKNDSMTCSIGMAPMRDHDNTAYMYNKGQWREFTGYFETAPGGQTSLAIFPMIKHSAIALLPIGTESQEVDHHAGNIDQELFSNFGYETPIECDADWARVISTPGDYAHDTLTIAYDAMPEGVEERTATFRITDGMDTIEFKLIQKRGEEPQPLFGDIDGNGEVNTTDVTKLYNVIFGTDTTTDKTKCNIDGSEDPEPNTSDVTALYNIIFGTAKTETEGENQ